MSMFIHCNTPLYVCLCAQFATNVGSAFAYHGYHLRVSMSIYDYESCHLNESTCSRFSFYSVHTYDRLFRNRDQLPRLTSTPKIPSGKSSGRTHDLTGGKYEVHEDVVTWRPSTTVEVPISMVRLGPGACHSCAGLA